MDGGSNCNFLSERDASKHLHTAPSSGTIGGIAGGLRYDQLGWGECTFDQHDPSSHHQPTIACLLTPKGDRNILSESWLIDELGILAPKDPPQLQCKYSGEFIAPLIRINGLYYTD